MRRRKASNNACSQKKKRKSKDGERPASCPYFVTIALGRLREVRVIDCTGGIERRKVFFLPLQLSLIVRRRERMQGCMK